jgi:hypothetical protein
LALQAEANLLGFDEKKWDSKDFTDITAVWGGMYDQVIRDFGFTGSGQSWGEGGTLWPIRVHGSDPAAGMGTRQAARAEASGKASGTAAQKASGKASSTLTKASGKASGGGGGGGRGGAFPSEPLKEFERFMGLDVFPHVVHVHHSANQLIDKYLLDGHTLAQNALTWPGRYTPFENTTRSLAPKDYYTDGSSCAIDAFNLAIGKVCTDVFLIAGTHTTINIA